MGKKIGVVRGLALVLLLVALTGLGFRSEGKTVSAPVKVKQVLPNGVTVVVEENFGAPVVAAQVWVNVGSADETDAEAGISHCIEHMLFKGTKKREVGVAAHEIESLGGDFNAYTNNDNTVFLVTISSRFFDQALDILSDMVQAPTFPAPEWAREKEVILEEIRRTKDSPPRRIYNYLAAAAFKVHPYTRPVIGYKETVAGFSRDDLDIYFHKWYVPSNLTVVVTGNVKADQVIAVVKRLFQKPAGAEKLVNRGPRKIIEPPQTETRMKVVREDVTEAYLALGFHIPAFAEEDVPALDLVSVILGEGESSRLVYRLRTERQLVNSIYAYSETPRDPGLFMVGATLPEKNAAVALDQIMKQLFILKTEPVADWELAKAKLALQTNNIYSRETVEGQAAQLGSYYTLTGDLDYEKVYLAKVKAVTTGDLQRVAAKYFRTENLSLAAIMPTAAKADEKTPATATPIFTEDQVRRIVKDNAAWDASSQPKSIEEPKPIAPPEVPVAEPTPALDAQARGVSAPVKYELPNGIRLIVRENHSVPLVSVLGVYEGGLRREDPDHNGVNFFIASAITEGTAHHSSAELHSMIEARAGSIGGFATRDAMGVAMVIPSFYFRSSLPLWTEVIREPTFPEEEVDRLRGIIVAGIKSKLDRPASYTFRLFLSELFQRHPYGLELMGSEPVVQELSGKDLLAYYRSFAAPGNLLIAVVGDVKALEVKKLIEDSFKDWTGKPQAPAGPAAEPPVTAPRLIEKCKEQLNQTNVVIGFPGARFIAADRYALDVLQSVLGGMSGRLFMNLREKQSLAYSVFPMNEVMLDPGFFAVYIGTAPEKEQTAREGIMKELADVRDQPVSAEELKRAKQVLIGGYEIGIQSYGAQTSVYAFYELYGLGFRAVEQYGDRVSAVTIKDVQAVAKKYLNPDAAVTAVVRPCAAPTP